MLLHVSNRTKSRTEISGLDSVAHLSFSTLKARDCTLVNGGFVPKLICPFGDDLQDNREETTGCRQETPFAERYDTETPERFGVRNWQKTKIGLG
jgi:hypothetical protein